ncbi:MAG: glycoside hydrolase family 1 protein [Bdellovibrionales bacterium]|nr:glycoside hydrolase family 1 protein [Oligoflexia bacterium]
MSTSKATSSAPTLPPHFRFCVSTAAHQVEGGNFNSDWWEWEQTPGHIKNGDTSKMATDSWNHLEEDLGHMSDLGVDTYRFSIEWAKIEPKPGEFDEVELARYVDQIDKLKARQIDSMVTLYHFTLPLWVSRQGGWEWDGVADAFDRFASHVASRVGNRVTLWLTLNEPMTIIGAGYVSNVFPPAKNNVKSIGLPMANMIRAHAKAYHSLHRILDRSDFKPRVGLAHHLRNFDARHHFNPADRYAAAKFDEIFNWALPRAMKTGELKFRMPLITRAEYFIPEAVGTQDFFGINYYTRDRISFNLFHNPPIVRSVTPRSAVSDLNWEIYPKGLDRLLSRIRLEFPKMPIWITENGLADQNDKLRMPYIESHLNVIAKQIAQGADIEGYCHWTLNDNFEWAEGYNAPFGFFSVDPVTFKRKARPSAQAFSNLIRSVRKQ